MRLRIGGRGSRLSLIQMEEVAELIRGIEPNIDFEYVRIRTTGDIDRDSPLYKLRSRGLFEREVNRALMNGYIDAAVHSAKDVPFESIESNRLTPIIPLRGSRYDVFVSRLGVDLWGLPPGSVVGSSSIRRISFIKYFRGDIEVKNIRGNVDTRVGKVFRGEYDGVVLAEAGVERLGLNIDYHRLPIERFVPAAGQGALLVLVRRGSDVEDLVRRVNDIRYYVEVMVEKLVVRFLGGGCSIPIGVTSFYDIGHGELIILAGLVDTNCSVIHIYRRSYALPISEVGGLNALREVARDFYEHFIDSGGGELIDGWSGFTE